MPYVAFTLGLTLGLLIAAGVARALYLRGLRAVRQAERRARASERLAEIGSMTGGLAHEIKNPLSTIGLNAQLLSEDITDSTLDEPQKRRLTTRIGALRRETERLRGILQDFLEFAGQLRLEARRADLAQVVSELVDFYTPEAARHGVVLRSDLADSPLNCQVDVRLLKQALLNLLINATQAVAGPAPAGDAHAPATRGEVLVRARRTSEPGGRGPRRPAASVIKLHVIDTGPGIAPDLLEKIFRPYFTTKSGGSGLGLPTARRIIEEHGGHLTVHSEPGKGTDFCITLPCEGETSDATAAHSEQGPAPSAR